MTRGRRLSSAVLAGALALVPLVACGNTSEQEGANASPEATVTERTPAEETSAETTDAEDTPGETGEAGTEVDVDCSGNTCSVTLSGDGAKADVLGTPVVLGGVENGRATVRVGDQELSCGQGESVSAGPLTLACSTVTEDSVTMSATLG